MEVSYAPASFSISAGSDQLGICLGRAEQEMGAARREEKGGREACTRTLKHFYNVAIPGSKCASALDHRGVGIPVVLAACGPFNR